MMQERDAIGLARNANGAGHDHALGQPLLHVQCV